jgi:hypothetical protein
MNSVDFPEKSIAKARELAEIYKKRYRSKRGRAVQLYSGDFLELKYGFSESVQQGNCGRYLHEIVKEADCFTMAGVLHLVARESALNPRLFYASGMKDIQEGRNPVYSAGSDHAFILVDIEKGEKHIVDPFGRLFGKVKLDEKRHVLQITNDADGKITERHYAQLREVSEEEYIQDVEKKRGPGGGRVALSATQAIAGLRGNRVYVTFIPGENKIRNSRRQDCVLFWDEPYDRVQVTDLTTEVDSAGKFDFEKGELSFYHATAAGWTSYINAQEPMKFSVEGMQKVWKIFESIAKANGRKTAAKRIHPFKLTEILWRSGFQSNFSVSEGSLAEEVISREGLASGLDDFLAEGEERASDIITRTAQDEVSYRSFLRKAQVTKEIDAARSEENPWGIVHPNEDFEEIVRTIYKESGANLDHCKEELLRFFEVYLKLKKGSRFHAKRSYNQCMGRYMDKGRYFGDVEDMRNDSFQASFKILADAHLLRRKHDVTGDLTKLSQGLTENDLRRAAQRALFQNAVNGFLTRDVLLLKRYRPGLQKILAVE